MSAERLGPVLVADAGSSSLRLAVFGDDGQVLAEHHSSSAPGDDAPGALRKLLDEAPARDRERHLRRKGNTDHGGHS
ncbi:2-keto-3-deoxy-galactonokinase [Streptomyces aurantiacus]|uniref:hypothetical protein n=1 Tax=Streptomyces aurantiacus TaxID=47760 RepID=UPI0027930E78|nr:hypothetical protein [Streptomyces aurantiacus]MDQ0774757.1 2-keto-3-deoxy-galactonokinase [Streptomyces aurantiacus]